MAWKGIVGKSFETEKFDQYCYTLQWSACRLSFVVLHNTARPTLAERPEGLTGEHIRNFERYYHDSQGWSAGPHLLADDRHIWVFTPLTVSGVHLPSWNKRALSVEMLSDYEREAFNSGRRPQVRGNTVAALAALAALSAALRAGRAGDDAPSRRPAGHARVPGQKQVRKIEIIQQVQDMLVTRHTGEHPIKPVPRTKSSDTAPKGIERHSVAVYLNARLDS